MSELDIAVNEVGGARLISLKGSIDISTRERFRDVLSSLSADTRLHLILDLSRVVYVDSAGIVALLTGFRKTTAAGGSYALVSIPETVRKVMAVRGLERILAFYPNVAAALAGMR